MSGETTLEPGYVYDELNGEVNNLNKLNRLGNPTVRVNSGAIGTDELADGSVTSDKLDEDIIAQINADAVLGDGSVTTAKLASGSVTYVKLNADVLAKMVERDTPTSTVGNFLRYVNTAGVTEEVTPNEMRYGGNQEALAANSTTGTVTITLSNNISDLNLIEGGFTVYRNLSGGTRGGSGSFTFIKTTGGTWDASGQFCQTNGNLTTGAAVGGTGTTSVTLNSADASGATISTTIAISGTSLTLTITGDGTLNSQSASAHAHVE